MFYSVKSNAVENAGDRGTYILVIVVEQELRLTIGRLGTVDFPRGHYLYVGSALRNLRARLSRHLRREKRIHWHIDLLLEHARVVEVWYRPGGERLECAWARALIGAPGLVPWGRRFGASDCRCPTHLYHSAERPVREVLWRRLPGGEGIGLWSDAPEV